MKKILLLIALLFLSTPSFAVTNWCNNASTQLCLTAEEGVTTVDDKSANDFTVTKANQATQSSAANPDTWSTFSYIFDGNDDELSITDSGGIIDFEGATEDFTACSFYNPDVVSGTTHSIYNIGDANDDFWRLIELQATSGNVWASLDTIDVKSNNDAVSVTTWNHICAVMDRDGNGQMWVNGVTNGAAVALSSETLNITSTAFHIGRDISGGLDMDGYLDELLIATILLDSTDINDIMDNGLLQIVSTFTTTFANSTVANTTAGL